MNNQNYFSMLRTVCDSYYNRHISLQDYKIQRSQILDQIEMDLNGGGSEPYMEGNEDITQPSPNYETQTFQADEIQAMLDQEEKKRQ